MKSTKKIKILIWDGVILFAIYICILAITFIIFKVKIGSVLGLALIIIGWLWYAEKFLESVTLLYEYYILNEIQEEETVILGFSGSAKLNIFYKTEYVLSYFDKQRMGNKPYRIINLPNYPIESGQNVKVEYMKRSRIVLDIQLVEK